MEYRQLGTSGLRVSKLCLGTMIGFEEERQADCDAIVGHAIDSGVNFIDTADCYGPSETVVGQALKNDGRRDEVVLATKFGWYVGDGPNDYGAGCSHIIETCEVSLTEDERARVDAIVPPGGRVSNYYEAYIYRAFRQDYAASARCGRGAGAFIPDHATGSDKRAGKD